MISIMKKLFSFIRPKTQRDYEDEYLAKSTDLIDLEIRQKKLSINPNLSGWV
mgnify:CR=1 FL=1